MDVGIQTLLAGHGRGDITDGQVYRESYAGAVGALVRMGSTAFIAGFLDATAHGTPDHRTAILELMRWS